MAASRTQNPIQYCAHIPNIPQRKGVLLRAFDDVSHETFEVADAVGCGTLLAAVGELRPSHL